MRAILAALVFVLFSVPASAREPVQGERITAYDWYMPRFDSARPAYRVQRVRAARVARSRKVAQATPLPRQTHEKVFSALSKPARYIAGRLVCALNVNAALAERGIRGTGSALAKSFLRWGRSSGPVPGAVAVWNRGRNRMAGHVAIIAKVDRGGIWYWNPSARGRGWRLVLIHKRPIAIRVST